MKNIRHIIAVASGKGGVGKSTVAINLALALQQQGNTVGLLDADIYGPSQPTMLGVTARANVSPEKRFQPILEHGIQTLSIGYLIDNTVPTIWRGPMVSKALQQLFFDTDWKALDYLVIDLPPGTGDIQLTLAQKIPVSGAVIVTTPQDIALIDARKGLEMFKKVKVPVLGIVENMSGYTCPQCGHNDPIFGSHGGEELAQTTATPLLAKISLHRKIREQTDNGTPPVIAEPNGTIAKQYYALANNVVAAIKKLDP